MNELFSAARLASKVLSATETKPIRLSQTKLKNINFTHFDFMSTVNVGSNANVNEFDPNLLSDE